MRWVEKQDLILGDSSIGNPPVRWAAKLGSTACGAMIWRVYPSVNFRASLVRIAVAAIALKQLGHPAAT